MRRQWFCRFNLCVVWLTLAGCLTPMAPQACAQPAGATPSTIVSSVTSDAVSEEPDALSIESKSLVTENSVAVVNKDTSAESALETLDSQVPDAKDVNDPNSAVLTNPEAASESEQNPKSDTVVTPAEQSIPTSAAAIIVTIPSPGNSSLLAPAGDAAAVIASVDGSTLTINCADETSISITCVGGLLKINGADPDSGPISIALISAIVVHSGPAANTITLSLNTTVARLSTSAEKEGNDTIIVSDKLMVTQSLTITAPFIKVTGTIDGGNVELASSRRTIIAQDSLITSRGGQIIVRGNDGEVNLLPGSKVDVSAPELGGKAGQIDVTGTTISAGGAIAATGGNGKISLSSGQDGMTLVDGTLDVSSPETGQTGGTIHVLGDKVGLSETARVNAFGDAGGGSILIGGDALGHGTVQNATQTIIAKGAVIDASALSKGNGGRVVIWSNQETPFEGDIAVRGGPAGGNGGFVEVSGKENLAFKGQVDVAAPLGQPGKLTLDPLFIAVLPTGPLTYFTYPDDLDYLLTKSDAVVNVAEITGKFWCELLHLDDLGVGCGPDPKTVLGDLDVYYEDINTVLNLIANKVRPLLVPFKIRASFNMVSAGTLELFPGDINMQAYFGIALLHDIDGIEGLAGPLKDIYGNGKALDFSKQSAGHTVDFSSIFNIIVMGDINVGGGDITLLAGDAFNLDRVEGLLLAFLNQIPGLPPGTVIGIKAAGFGHFLHNLNVTDLFKLVMKDLTNPTDQDKALQALEFVNGICHDCVPNVVGDIYLLNTAPYTNLDKIPSILTSFGVSVPSWVTTMFDIIDEVGSYAKYIDLSPTKLIDYALGGITIPIPIPFIPDIHIDGLCDYFDELPCSISALVADVAGPLIIDGVEALVTTITGKDFDSISSFFNTPIVIPDFSVENDARPVLHVNDAINNPSGKITLNNPSFGSIAFAGPLTANNVTINTPRGPIRNAQITQGLTHPGAGSGEIKANTITLNAAGGIGQITGFGPNNGTIGFLGSLLSSIGGNGPLFVDGGDIPYLSITAPSGSSVTLNATNKGKGGIFLKSNAPLTLSSASRIYNQNEDISGAFAPAGSQEIVLENTGGLTINGTVTNERGGATITAHSPLTINGTQSFAGDVTLEAGALSTPGDDLSINAAVNAANVTLKAGDNLNVAANGSVSAIGTMTATAGQNIAVDGSLTATSTLTTTAKNIAVAGTLAGTNLTLSSADNVTLAAGSTITASGTVTINADVADSDSGGSTVTIAGTVTATELSATGGNEADIFNVMPQANAVVRIDGSDPKIYPGDSLSVQTPTGATLTQAPAGVDGYKPIYVSGHKTIYHIHIETLLGVPPTVTMGPDANATIKEAGTYKSSVSFIDYGSNAWTVKINYGDGSPVETVSLTGGADGDGPFPVISLSHVYGDNGVYTVDVEVIHSQDNVSGHATATVTVTNLNTVTYLVTSPAIIFKGGNAFLGRKGVPQQHTATGGDPGSDDLRFDWTYELGVGPTFTGKTTFASKTYFNNGAAPATGPFTDALPSSLGNFPFFNGIDTATVTFTAPGVYRLTATVTDDDSGTSAQSLAKLITDNTGCSKGWSYWRHQFYAFPDREIDDVTLQHYLDIVNYASAVFSEKYAASTIADAQALLAPGGATAGGLMPDSLKGKAIQDTFVAWLNFAAGGVLWADTVRAAPPPLPKPLRAQLFNEAIARAELILLKPSASLTEYEDARKIARNCRKLYPPSVKSPCMDAVVNLSLSPDSGSSLQLVARIFTATYWHPDDFTRITQAKLRVSSADSNASAMVAYYDATANKLYLMNDAGSGWLGGFAPGSANIISNSQGSLNCAGTSVIGKDEKLTVVWSLTPAAKLAGTTQKLCLYVQDLDTLSDGWTQFGTWSITAPPVAPPVTISLVTAQKSPTNTVVLGFTGALDATVTTQLPHYAVTVNGKTVIISNVTYAAGTNSVTLTLPASSVPSKAAVIVQWSGLSDTLGRAVADGQSTVTAS